MYSTSIVNPKTGRSNQVKAWDVSPKNVLAEMKSGRIKTARDLSWALLNDTESVKAMESTMERDSVKSGNFALSVFENALDWSLGLQLLAAIRAFVKAGKLPKVLTVAVNAKGDVFVLYKGQVIL